MSDPGAVTVAVETVFRADYGSLLAALIRRGGGDFEGAEEALGDAFTSALAAWPSEGIPDHPAAWIQTVARRRQVDAQRRRHTRGERADGLDAAAWAEENGRRPREDEFPHEDDRLRLIFTCCHPALAHESRVALTLNTLCGLRTTEIARAFLTKESTLAQRLVRAKRKIREAGIPYRVPPPHLLAERLPAVLGVAYLVFNEGYSATQGDAVVRRELCAEAIRLVRILVELMPKEPEVRGLLALMLLQDSRRDARQSPTGEIVLLDDQDRTLWDRPAIDEGLLIIEGALALRVPGPYQLQAAIAALHAEPAHAGDTDWPQIELLYNVLLRMQHSPVFVLNRAVAVAMVRGPEAGLQALGELERDGSLKDYVYLHATRGDLLRRLGRTLEARAAYARALALTCNAPERRFLQARLDEMPFGDSSHSGDRPQGSSW